MPTDTFRQDLHRIADWVADYRANTASRPVLSSAQPGEIAKALPDAAPENPEPLDAIIRDLADILLPGITHWNHPRFFAYFPANKSEPSILAELVTAAIGAQILTSPTPLTPNGWFGFGTSTKIASTGRESEATGMR